MQKERKTEQRDAVSVALLTNQRISQTIYLEVEFLLLSLCG